jgi:hypothetical protein
MKHRRRRWSRALAGASLLGCIVTTILWAISYWIPTQAVASKTVGQSPVHTVAFAFDSSRGVLGFAYRSIFSNLPSSEGWNFRQYRPIRSPLFYVDSPTIPGRLGFHVLHQNWPVGWDVVPSGRMDTYGVEFHYWFLTVVFLVIFAIAMRRLAAARSVDPAICKSCGYDLRATPDRCPECGTPPSAKVK